jgi:hypothetical protein
MARTPACVGSAGSASCSGPGTWPLTRSSRAATSHSTRSTCRRRGSGPATASSVTPPSARRLGHRHRLVGPGPGQHQLQPGRLLVRSPVPPARLHRAAGRGPGAPRCGQGRASGARAAEHGKHLGPPVRLRRGPGRPRPARRTCRPVPPDDPGLGGQGFPHRLLRTPAATRARRRDSRAAAERRDLAQDHFRRGIAVADRMPYQTERWDTRRWYATTAIERGRKEDRATARRLLTEALAGFASLHTPRHAELARTAMSGQG